MEWEWRRNEVEKFEGEERDKVLEEKWELGMEREGKGKALELEVKCLGSWNGRNERAGIGKEKESVAWEWNREKRTWEWGSGEWLRSGKGMGRGM